MIITTLITDRYQLQVDYTSREEITVTFIKDFCGRNEQRFEYDCPHYMDAVGHVLKVKDYFEDSEFNRFYQTVITLFE